MPSYLDKVEMSNEECKDCKFYFRAGSECRKSAPKLFYNVETKQKRVMWPNVSYNDWCGEWVSKKSEVID